MQIRVGIPYVFVLVMEKDEFVNHCKNGWKETKRVTSKVVDVVQPVATKAVLATAVGACVVARVVANVSCDAHDALQQYVVESNKQGGLS